MIYVLIWGALEDTSSLHLMLVYKRIFIIVPLTTKIEQAVLVALKAFLQQNVRNAGTMPLVYKCNIQNIKFAEATFLSLTHSNNIQDIYSIPALEFRTPDLCNCIYLHSLNHIYCAPNPVPST